MSFVLGAYQTGWETFTFTPANGATVLAASTSPAGETRDTVKFPVVGNVDLFTFTNDNTAPEYDWKLHVQVVP